MAHRPPKFLLPLTALLLSFSTTLFADWPQHGQGPQHRGEVGVIAQLPLKILADVVYDPFIAQELAASNGALFAHFAAPLVQGNDIYMAYKSGTYTSPTTWETQNWGVHRLSFEGTTLVDKWAAVSDWDPVPYGGPRFEPVFHPLLANGFLYQPGKGGTVQQIRLSDGHLMQQINPFGTSIDSTIFVTGPLSADVQGNIYYNAMKLDLANAWLNNIRGAWLVKITAAGVPSVASFANLIPGAPDGASQCRGVFTNQQLPWPPSPNAEPGTVTCGSQRPGVNIAPAIAADGTIYTISRAHFNSRYGYVVAVNPDLTPKWSVSMRNLLHDGCNVIIPPNGTPGGCRAGAATGVDPSDNLPGSGSVTDDSTSSPVVAPDGAVIYGAYTRYNYSQGHTLKFSPSGEFLAAYAFGWDTTPAIWEHDRTYSIVTKENRYQGGAYCGGNSLCPPTRQADYPQGYYITQLDKNLTVEWKFQNTESLACNRLPDGSISCGPSDEENGFEWCVNAPAIDARGDIFVNSEDGNLYQISQHGILAGRILLQSTIGAAYTPLSIGSNGLIYAQNSGHLFVIGGQSTRRRAVRK
jgi:hypothetical protein